MRKRLALAVAARRGHDPLPFLAALARDPEIHCVEIHVAHDWPADVYPQVSSDSVAYHPHPQGTPLSRLWGAAIARCDADYVAVLDISCPPAAEWLSAALSEMDRHEEVFFGPVSLKPGRTQFRTVSYLVEYAQFAPPLSPKLKEVPGNNIVFRRDLLPEADDLVRNGFVKTIAIWELARKGFQKIPYNDNMKVEYTKELQESQYLRRRYWQGRSFAAQRRLQPDSPPRILCLLFTPALPFLRTWRIYRHVRGNAELASAYFGALLQILRAESAWSWGEFAGYLTGNAGTGEIPE